MRKFALQLPLLILLISLSSRPRAQDNSLVTGFEKDHNTTATYEETIDYYKLLDKEFSQLQLTAQGNTDSGYPLHLAVLSVDEDFSPESLRAKGRRILFINNAIHPGEPCGVDASMLLLRDLLTQKEMQAYLEDLVLVVIPFYNIGGGLNRGSYSRANQQGPEAYGFRGNAKNLDLNRDFIKCDSWNARTFNQIYNQWLPDVFIDNHTSNGADYQYAISMVTTQHNKLDPHLAAYLNETLMPRMYRDMKESGWEMTPYVNARSTPDEGIAGFLDLPRYSSGYAALHNAFSFMSETHMLKPYRDRVLSTYAYMTAMIRFLHKNGDEVAAVRQKAIDHTIHKKTFELNWTLDRERSDSITFKGYAAKYKPSAVTGKDRLYYDRNEPYTMEIPFYHYYEPTLSVEKPVAYLIPQGYREVIDRLQWNGVQLKRLTEDVEPELEMYYIRDHQTGNSPYEGHYLHRQVEVEKKSMHWKYRRGDYVVFVDQPSNRYIVETLEPQAPDSYFAWNFFDAILDQKEYFSSYVFEDLAARFLEAQPEVKAELEKKKAADQEFARSARAQLDFVYRRSPHYEPTHQLYPVGRLVRERELPVE